MYRELVIKLLCFLLISNSAIDGYEDEDEDDNEEFTDDELGTVPEDLSEYKWQERVFHFSRNSIIRVIL